MISEDHEPFTDIVEGDRDVAVTIEIPYVEKEDIDFNVTEDTLEIMVNISKRKYHKLLDLPCDVKTKTMKTTFKNGVLDVILKKKKKNISKGYRAAIE